MLKGNYVGNIVDFLEPEADFPDLRTAAMGSPSIAPVASKLPYELRKSLKNNGVH